MGEDCKHCHGIGYLKSYCDAPDRVCPWCRGSGIAGDDYYEPGEDTDVLTEEGEVTNG